MLKHRRDDDKRFGIDNLTSTKNLQETKKVKVLFEVDPNNVVTEENAETNRPQGWDVPKSPKAARHNCEAARLSGEFRRVDGAMDDKQSSENFATMHDNFGIIFRKQVQEPLPNVSTTLGLNIVLLTLFVTVRANFLILARFPF